MIGRNGEVHYVARKRFEKLSLENDDTKQLYSIWCVTKEQLTQRLEGVTQYFPHFSLHNASHSKTITQQVELFLGADRIERLSATDIWMLLMSFYSHDIGMAVKYEDVYEFFKSNSFKEKVNELINSPIKDVAETAKRVCSHGVLYSGTENEKSFLFFNDIRFIIETYFRNEHAMRSKGYLEELMEAMFYREPLMLDL